MLLTYLVGIVSAFIITAVFTVLTWSAIRSGRNTKEAVCRRIGFCSMLAIMAMITTLLTYAISKPIVVRDGQAAFDTSPTVVWILFCGIMATFVVMVAAFTISYIAWRKRVRRCREEYWKLHSAIREEYGTEVGSEIMRRAGHRSKLEENSRPDM